VFYLLVPTPFNIAFEEISVVDVLGFISLVDTHAFGLGMESAALLLFAHLLISFDFVLSIFVLHPVHISVVNV